MPKLPGKALNSRNLSASVLACVICLSQAAAGLAAAYPGTGAPIVVIREMSSKNGDIGNPFSYPLLSSVAKSLVRNGFPASFFLGLDSKAGPGIDLRTILLYEAGVLKQPVKLFLPPRQKKLSGFLDPASSSIPESAGEMPTIAPKLHAPGSLEASVNTKANEQAAAMSKTEATAQDASSLNLDFNRFSIDLSDSQLKNELTTKVNSEVDTIAMTSALSFDQPKASVPDAAFRFWTVPQALSSFSHTEKLNTPYEDSFVMMSPHGLKAIEGRTFFLSAGKILLCSRGKSMSVTAPMAQVNVEPGATALVEIVKPGYTRIRVLESESGEHGVSVKFNSLGKGEDIRLKAGDDVLITDHTLNDSDKAIQAKPTSGSTASGGDNWSKVVFSPAALIDSDSFFNTDARGQNNEQRSAVVLLRKRIK